MVKRNIRKTFSHTYFFNLFVCLQSAFIQLYSVLVDKTDPFVNALPIQPTYFCFQNQFSNITETCSFMLEKVVELG